GRRGAAPGRRAARSGAGGWGRGSPAATLDWLHARAPSPQPAQDPAPPRAAQFARSAPPAPGAPPVHGVAPGRHAVSEEGGLTLAQVAARAAVSPATVRRWVREGLVPPYDGVWTPAAASHVRIVARLRERGYRIERIREASQG